MIWFYKNNARAIGKRNHLIMNILKDCRRKNSYDDEHEEVMGSRLPTFDIMVILKVIVKFVTPYLNM